MSKEISKISTPEEIELEAKQRDLAALEEEVAERELELATCRAELHHFEAAYLPEVGVYLYELDEFRAQIAEKIVAVSPGDEPAQFKAKEARKQAEQSGRATEDLDRGDRLEGPFEPSDEFKKLDRMAALKFHSDTTTDENERIERKKTMAKINQLFEEGKEDELRDLLDNYSKRSESVEGEGIAFDLVRAIRKLNQLRQRLVAIENELDALRKSELFELFEQVTEAQKEGADLLKNMQASLKDEIQEAKERLAALD